MTPTLAKRKTKIPVPPISCRTPWRVSHTAGRRLFSWWGSSETLCTSFELKGLWESGALA